MDINRLDSIEDIDVDTKHNKYRASFEDLILHNTTQFVQPSSLKRGTTEGDLDDLMETGDYGISRKITGREARAGLHHVGNVLAKAKEKEDFDMNITAFKKIMDLLVKGMLNDMIIRVKLYEKQVVHNVGAAFGSPMNSHVVDRSGGFGYALRGSVRSLGRGRGRGRGRGSSRGSSRGRGRGRGRGRVVGGYEHY
jgi:hypothetical protein